MRGMTRRTAIKGAAAIAAAAALRKPLMSEEPATEERQRIPLVHITDLYHPPQDPDDHVDLATIVALKEYDLRGVVLDATRKFLVARPEGWDIARDPGFVPVAKLSQLLGRAIPVAAGPIDPLAHAGDTAEDRPAKEQAGIELFLDLLKGAAEPVTVSVVGSCRVISAAFNRAPELLRARTRAILLNAGSTAGPKREWNVGLDPFAYEALWRSGLPIHWFPCGTDLSAFDPAHERGTFWKTEHSVLFRDLRPGLRDWFAFAFANPGGEVQGIPDGERNMWSTISLAMGAGRVLARTADGWRFVPEAAAAGNEVWPCRLDTIRATLDLEARVSWELADGKSPLRLFGRKPGAEFGTVMAEALNALLREVSGPAPAASGGAQLAGPNS